MRVPWTARRSKKSTLKKINSEYSLEGLMLKLQYFGYLMRRANSLEKILTLEKIEKGTTENEMAVWHHQIKGQKFEETLGDSRRQRTLACYSPRGHKESNTT